MKGLLLFTLAVFAWLLLPGMVQQGMFLDGISYGAIAKNMALGFGSFSKPYYTETLYPVCHEQPPLAFWIQSKFFKILGDGFWVEKSYNVVVAFVASVGIVFIWRDVLKEIGKSTATAYHLPLLLWITAPIVFWCLQNNMLETTQTLFVLWAVFAAGRFAASGAINWLLLACAGIICAVGAKGPVGLFPLVVPTAWYFGMKQGTFQTSVWRSLWLASAVVLCWSAILFWNPELQEYQNNYLKTRLLPTLEGLRDEVAAYRFKFLEDLLSQWIPAGALSLILWWRYGKEKRGAVQWESVRYFLLIGLAGTVPLAFSAKQSAHYLAPAMPFFALAFAAFMVQVLPSIKLNERMSKWFRGTMAAFLLSALLFTISKTGNYARDQAIIEDVKLLIQTVGENSAIGTSKSFGENWGLIAYLSRLGNVHLKFEPPFKYYLGGQDEQPDPLILAQFKHVDLPLRHFNLYENKSK